MNTYNSPPQIQAQINQLKEELQVVRANSLNATRNGDYARVARLTTEAARINRQIVEAEGQLILETR